MQQRENANIINPMHRRSIVAKIKIKLTANYFVTKNLTIPHMILKKFREHPQKINGDISKIKWGENGIDETCNTINKCIIDILAKEYPNTKERNI